MSDFPGRLLGVDHGTKVIGLATCDRIGLIASPYGILKRKSRQEDFDYIKNVMEQEQVVGVIVGLPPRPPDFVGTSQSDIVRKWTRRFAHQVTVPVYYWDEGLSTHDAEQLLREADKTVPERMDAHAAAVILQSFLDAFREGQPFPIPLINRQGR